MVIVVDLDYIDAYLLIVPPMIIYFHLSDQLLVPLPEDAKLVARDLTKG